MDDLFFSRVWFMSGNLLVHFFTIFGRYFMEKIQKINIGTRPNSEKNGLSGLVSPLTMVTSFLSDTSNYSCLSLNSHLTQTY